MDVMDLISTLGTVLDTPGAMLRTSLAGENPLSAVFDTDKRVSGRQLLERYGLAGKNEDQGWIPDAGDLGGFVAEMVLDPTNLIGGGLMARLMGKAGKAKTANKTITAANELSQQQRLQGFMPEEIAKLTKIVDETGKPKVMYHGTLSPDVRSSRDLKIDKSGSRTGADQGEIGRGIYFTDDPLVANEYADPHQVNGFLDPVSRVANGLPIQSAVHEAFVDVRNPRHLTHDESLIGSQVEELVQAGKVSRDELRQLPFGDAEGVIARQFSKHLADNGYDGATRALRLEEASPFELMVPDSAQVYLPYIAKEMQALKSVPNSKPLLSALLGHNAVAREEWEAN